MRGRIVGGLLALTLSASSVADDTTSLFSKVKDFLDQNGKVKLEFYVGRDFRVESSGIYVCETFDLKGNPLEACYPISSRGMVTEEGTVQSIARSPFWYKYGGRWYTDENLDGINNNEVEQKPLPLPLRRIIDPSIRQV